MKKIIAVLLFIAFLGFGFEFWFSKDVIYTTADGTRLKCTAKKNISSIKEYGNNITDYYTFKNGKIYSDNLNKVFGTKERAPKRVWRLKITDKEITFKDRIYLFKASHYKWVTIDRKTGKYTFDGKKQYNWMWYFQQINANGYCRIVK